MIRELKERFDELPWFVKILITILGINYIFQRKGLFWRVLQGSIIFLLAALLFPVFFFVYFVFYAYYYIQTHENVLMYLGIILLFLLIIIIEIVLFLTKYKKKRKKEKRENHDRHSRLWYVFPLLLGGLGGILVYILVKDKNYGRRLISVGFIQTIILLIGLLSIAVITDEPPQESFIVMYSYDEDSLTLRIRNTSKGYITIRNIYQNGEIVLTCEERIGINQEKEIIIEGDWYEGDIITVETKKGIKTVLLFL